jgi:hypothetical protein
VSSLFLFGAGASYGSGPCIPHAPPRGNDLFEALRKRGGVAAEFPTDIADTFAHDFEGGMDLLWERHNTQVTALLLDMAAYFAQFTAAEGNYYSRLISLLGGDRKRSTLVTINYDLLIEQAITSCGFLVAYHSLPVPKRNIPVLKIRGSCNFLPAMTPRQISGIGYDLSQSPDCSILETHVRVARSSDEVLQFCRTEESIAPALAMYAPGKRVLYCRDFVTKQQEAWVQSASAASRIFVIGPRVHHKIDKHIWEPLASASGAIYYVGSQADEWKAWAREVGRKNAFHLATTFEEALPRIPACLSR